jgi:CheY-like chemotaxis protein
MSNNQFSFGRVMIIDDTEIDRYVTSFIISKHGYSDQIIEFDMARKALLYIDSCKNDITKLPRVIFLDIRMPEMDGFEFLEKLSDYSEVLTNCEIIMLSSSLDPTDYERSEKFKQVKHFLNKPLNEDKLLSVACLLKAETLTPPKS